VDGLAGGGSRYTVAQRHRLFREGVRGFFRLDEKECASRLRTMGDCGAFAYWKEETPPVSAEDVADFYDILGFDYGVSVDHIIAEYRNDWDRGLPGMDLVPASVRRRQEITLDLANEFWHLHRSRGSRFEPIGVAQGWSPESYAFAVSELQKIGYTYIGLGGLVPLRTHDVLESVKCASRVRQSETRFHVFGVTRVDEIRTLSQYGVASFDSTSPLRQAFKDDKDNYYTADWKYAAIRVPQVEGNPKLKRLVTSGQISYEEAKRLEQACLSALMKYDQDQVPIGDVLGLLSEYESLYNGVVRYAEANEKLLQDRPWKACQCEVCKSLGIHVVLFRGAERNRRRGFHNIYVTYQRVRDELAAPAQAT